MDSEPPDKVLSDIEAKQRVIVTGFFGMTCSRCQMLFDSDTEAEDHINGPNCG